MVAFSFAEASAVRLTAGAVAIEPDALEWRVRSTEGQLAAGLVCLFLVLAWATWTMDLGRFEPAENGKLFAAVAGVCVGGFVGLRALRRYGSCDLPRALLQRSWRSDAKGLRPRFHYLARSSPARIAAHFCNALGLESVQYGPHAQAAGERLRKRVRRASLLIRGAAIVMLFVATQFLRDFEPWWTSGLPATLLVVYVVETRLFAQWWAGWFGELLDGVDAQTGAGTPTYSKVSTSMPRVRSPVNR